jgi:hypothetical protein
MANGRSLVQYTFMGALFIYRKQNFFKRTSLSFNERCGTISFAMDDIRSHNGLPDYSSVYLSGKYN